MAITWGNIVYGNSDEKRSGKVGIEILDSSTNDVTTLTVNVYFASKYGVTDSSNVFYYDVGKTAATTSRGSVSINHTNNSGDGWGSSNQTKLGTYTYKYNRTVNDQTINFSAKLSGIDYVKATPTVSTSFTVKALPKYKVTYNANGGSGAPSGTYYQSYGKALTLSTTTPSRTGYKFKNWNTEANGSGTSYNPGDKYIANVESTLYAQWAPYKYTVKYDANGGSNAPTSQTKAYGETVTLASSSPIRDNYNFLGWSLSSTATTATYTPGEVCDDWKNDPASANTSATLYAIWELAYIKPSISNVLVGRCDSNGNSNDEGTYFYVSFDWSINDPNYSPKDITIEIDGETCHSSTITDRSGAFPLMVLGDNAISTENNYSIRITVSDTYGSGSVTKIVSQVAYTIDILAGGKGIAFGKPANREGFTVAMDMYDKNGNPIPIGTKCIDSGEVDLNDYTTTGSYVFTTGATITNIPVGINGYLLVIANGGYIKQLWFRHGTMDSNDYNTYVRTYWSGTWSSWRQFIVSGDGATANLYAIDLNNRSGTGTKYPHIDFAYDTSPATSGILPADRSYDYRIAATAANAMRYYCGASGATSHTFYLNNNTDGMQLRYADSGYRLHPIGNNTVYLGDSTHKWISVYATNGTIQTSDREKKKDFTELDEYYESLFFDLKPILFRFKDNTSNRLHCGFISQDIEASLTDNNLTALDFAGFCKDKALNIEYDEDLNEITSDKLDEDGNQMYDYSLRYDEFIALNTHMLQKAYELINAQQIKIDELEERLTRLEQKLSE